MFFFPLLCVDGFCFRVATRKKLYFSVKINFNNFSAYSRITGCIKQHIQWPDKSFFVFNIFYFCPIMWSCIAQFTMDFLVSNKKKSVLSLLCNLIY